MTNIKTTKRALLTSVMALLLCFSMLLGTTYAWFTDSVGTVNNVIVLGNLDVELYWSLDAENWAPVKEDTNVFTKDLWEPGHTEVIYLKVANEGSLALKYNLKVNIESETSGVNAAGETFSLSDYIQYGIKGTNAAYASADEAVSAVADVAAGLKNSYAKNTYLLPREENVVAMVVYMPSSVGNVVNHNGSVTPSINLGIHLFATQMMDEEDSYGNTYDADAILPWDGSIGEVPAAEDGVITIYTAEELAAFAHSVNVGGQKYAGVTVKLGANIDLANRAWTPIGQTGKTQFMGAFDGNGKTIYNLYVDNTANTSQYCASGLFGWIEQHSGSNSIRNLTIDGVKLVANTYIGAVAGRTDIPVVNCTVKNANITGLYVNDDTDGSKVGALVGYADNRSNLIGNTVDNAVINGYCNVGGLVGTAQTTVNIDGNTVKNVSITYVSGAKSIPTAFASTRVKPIYGENYSENVTITKSSLVSTAAELAAALLDTVNKNVSIVLANDIDMPRNLLIGGNAGDEYKMGNADTETIVVDLNGHKLNVTTTYWSVLGTVNPNTVVTFKNGSMTSSQATGTWNSYDLCFQSGKFVFENVVFGKAICLSTDATLKNVTINESHDYYAIWMETKGQTVEIDGLTVNSSRGIKIDEQYDNTPEKVTLKVANATFNTAKKAAIVVKSAAGADVTLSNMNIAGVAADPIHAVWVDDGAAAYADLVTVVGGEKIIEGTVEVVRVATAAELQAALDAATVNLYALVVADITGNVTVTQKEGINVVIDGNNKAFTGTIDIYGQSRNDGAETLTIKNVNFVASETMDFVSCNYTDSERRYAHNVTIEGCSFVGNGAEVMGARLRQCYNITLKNCTADGMYGVLWATGCDGIVVENVTATNGRNGLSLGTSINVTIDNCALTTTAYGIRADGTGAFNVTVTNCQIASAQPIVVRKLNAAGFSLTLAGNSLNPTVASDYQVILTAGSDDAAYVAPAVAYTLIGAGDLNVFA